MRFLGTLMNLSPMISSTPAFCMEAPTTKIEASMIMKSLPNPRKASAGVSIPRQVSIISRPTVIRSTENLSVAKRIIAMNKRLMTNAISNFTDF